VGYLLAIKHDRSWTSPVEKVRKLHCQDAVETFDQEKYVYGILGLDIQITRTFTKGVVVPATKTSTYKVCPICDTQSMYIDAYGMCLTCQSTYAKIVPEKFSLTLQDLDEWGGIPHTCDHKNCVGIWTAEICKHTVHDQIIYDGYCEACWNILESAENSIEDVPLAVAAVQSSLAPCAVCEQPTAYAKTFGICYDCAETLAKSNAADYVHNSITDPYKMVPHTCNDVGCTGIVIADMCEHVVHNLEIVDGRCPQCAARAKPKEA
jgi:ribosomal protein S14